MLKKTFMGFLFLSLVTLLVPLFSTAQEIHHASWIVYLRAGAGLSNANKNIVQLAGPSVYEVYVPGHSSVTLSRLYCVPRDGTLTGLGDSFTVAVVHKESVAKQTITKMAVTLTGISTGTARTRVFENTIPVVIQDNHFELLLRITAYTDLDNSSNLSAWCHVEWYPN